MKLFQNYLQFFFISFQNIFFFKKKNCLYFLTLPLNRTNDSLNLMYVTIVFISRIKTKNKNFYPFIEEEEISPVYYVLQIRVTPLAFSVSINHHQATIHQLLCTIKCPAIQRNKQQPYPKKIIVVFLYQLFLTAHFVILLISIFISHFITLFLNIFYQISQRSFNAFNNDGIMIFNT